MINNHLNNLLFEELQPIAFPLANRFYRANGHKGKARSDERVFVLRQEGQIIAAREPA